MTLSDWIAIIACIFTVLGVLIGFIAYKDNKRKAEFDEFKEDILGNALRFAEQEQKIALLKQELNNEKESFRQQIDNILNTRKEIVAGFNREVTRLDGNNNEIKGLIAEMKESIDQLLKEHYTCIIDNRKVGK